MTKKETLDKINHLEALHSCLTEDISKKAYEHIQDAMDEILNEILVSSNKRFSEKTYLDFRFRAYEIYKRPAKRIYN